MSSPWDNAANVATLKKLWAEGLTASQIANRIGGITRNSVISKVHRLGLSGRAPSRAEADARNGVMARRMKARKKADRERKAVTKKPPVLAEAVGAGQNGGNLPINDPGEPEKARTVGGPVPFSERRNGECVWPMWEIPGEPRMCCGAPRVTGSSYCEAHRKRSISDRQPKPRMTK